MTPLPYELAKELKDAGFPQDGRGTWPSNGPEPEDQVYAPTLSELIEACGELAMYFGLEKHSNDWRAGKLKPGNIGIKAFSGSTPEEAVARLWLALYKQ